MNFAILPNKSLTMTVSPLFLLNRQALPSHCRLFSSVSSSSSDKIFSFSGQSKLMLDLSSSLSWSTAAVQRLSLRVQKRKLGHGKGCRNTQDVLAGPLR